MDREYPLNPRVSFPPPQFIKRTLAGLAAPALFILLVMAFFHSRSRLQFDADEGLNLMRAMLIDQGFSLYEDIWSDQPPVYPHVLAAAFQVIGYKVGGARFISILFSSLIVWGVYQFLLKVCGRTEAILGAVLLVLLPEYLRLSVSVMVGLPALSLAMVALIFLVFWHNSRRMVWLLLSGLLLGVSIQTKLFTAILVPVYAGGILLTMVSYRKSGSTSWAEIVLPPLIWGIGCLTPVVVIALVLIKPENFPLLFEGHISASDALAFQGQAYEISYHLREALPIVFLGAVGAVQAIRQRRWLMLYPAFWLLFGYLFVLYLHPNWYHHQLLVTIPAVLPASYALAEAFRWIIRVGRDALDPHNSRAFQVLASLGLLSIAFALIPPSALANLSPYPSFATTGLEVGVLKEKLITTVIEYAPETNWMVTDQPMIAFRAHIPVPPEIAVLSRKRWETGGITEETLIQIVKDYRPEQVLLGRFDFPDLEAHLNENYSLELDKPGEYSLYIRLDVLDD